MTWAKFDDRFPSHLKVLRLSDAAFRLFVTSVCFSCEQLTDGAIDAGIPETLPRAPTGKRLKEAIAELEKSGLWEPSGSGWVIHDFLDWNPDAQKVLAKREAAKERMKRARSSRSPPNNERSSPDVRANNERSSPNPVPVPVPVPSNKLEDPPNPPTGDFPLSRTWDPGPGVFLGTQVPDWAHAELLGRFRGYHCNGNKRRSERDWVQSYVRWACGELARNPPQKPEAPRDLAAEAKRDEIQLAAAKRRRDAMFAAAGIDVAAPPAVDLADLTKGIG